MDGEDSCGSSISESFHELSSLYDSEIGVDVMWSFSLHEVVVKAICVPT